jgi:hypothetical protein
VVAPSRWTGRRIALLIGGIFGGVVAFITAVSVLAIFVVVPMWRASSPEWLVNNAARRLDAAAVVHVHGSFLDIAGRRVELDARVANDRFMATQRIDGQVAEFRTAQNVTYVKGSAGFWNIVDPAFAGVFADTWVRDELALRLQLDPFAEPDVLARALREQFATQAKGEKQQVRGVDTMRITSPGKGAVYVARQAPYGIVRLEGPVVGGTIGSPLSGYVFDVDELSEPETDEFDAALRDLPKQFPTALDPDEPGRMPAFYVVEDVLDKDDCGLVSCQFRAKVKNLNGPARPGAKHLLIGALWEGKDATGKVLGRCETVLKPLAKDATGEVSCVTSDPRWERWTGAGWYSWNLTTFNPGWEGSDPAIIGQLIERRVDMDLIDEVADSGGLGLRTFARLIQYPGANHADAAAMVKSAADMNHLDSLLAYAETGRIGNVRGLRTWVESAAAARHTIANALPYVNQLQAAAARSKDGTGPVALQNWAGGGVTVKADIVDVGRKEAVQVRTVVGHEVDAAVVAARTAAAGAVVAPATFRRVLDLRIAHSGNPLHGLGKAELRDALRKAGLKAAVDAVVVVNGTGRHEYGSADFR